MSANVERYQELLQREKELRTVVIETQGQDLEDERINITLERESLLFQLSESELEELRR